jgi:RNA polymerase sigma factor (sigma-70 family)
MKAHRAISLTASFQEHYADLLRFLNRRLGCAERAADVAQDTYLRLAGLDSAARPIEDNRAFVFRIAGNLAIDSLRRDGRLARQRADEDLPSLIDESPSHEAVVLSRECLHSLDNLLNELPANARQALLCNRVDGMTHAEIAALLGVSESMVAKYIAQALRHCRDGLRRCELR